MDNIEEVLKDAKAYGFLTNPEDLIVEKKWGKEYIICRRPHAAKVMILEPDCQVSLHWHEQKSETFILIEGELIVETVDINTGITTKTDLYSKFSSITLDNRVPHTFYCPEGQVGPTIFIEASTEDKDHDSYRIFPSQGKEDPDNRGSNCR